MRAISDIPHAPTEIVDLDRAGALSKTAAATWFGVRRILCMYGRTRGDGLDQTFRSHNKNPRDIRHQAILSVNL
jgi:hypothetical protein